MVSFTSKRPDTFNRTELELKPAYDTRLVQNAFAFNRTELELKLFPGVTRGFGVYSFNRTELELKRMIGVEVNGYFLDF